MINNYFVYNKGKIEKGDYVNDQYEEYNNGIFLYKNKSMRGTLHRQNQHIKAICLLKHYHQFFHLSN